MLKATIGGALVAVALIFAAGAASAAPAHKSNGVYVDSRGMTLYTYDNDSTGNSNCMLGCAIAWPPFYAASNATASGSWSLVAHGGKKMWALRGHPLYFYVKDKKPGDKTGDGAGGVWHVAR